MKKKKYTPKYKPGVIEKVFHLFGRHDSIYPYIPPRRCKMCGKFI